MEKSNKSGILLEVGTNEVEFLRFSMCKQHYGINVSKICQIMLLERSKITPIPGQSAEVLGITTFRDKTISVVDLRLALNLKIDDTSDSSRELLMITEFNSRTTGFVIDAVDRIERCTWSQFEPAEKTVCNKDSGYFLGTVNLKDGIVIIVDMETVMAKIDPSSTVEFYQRDIPTGTGDRSGLNIVYCEDSLIVQKILIKTLEQAGFKNIKTFATGVEGLDFLKNTSPGEVDIILSDIEMPKMDGLTFCKETRSLEGYESKPFIFFSSMINSQMAAKCKSVGANACFSKPEIQEIVAKIDSLIVK